MVLLLLYLVLIIAAPSVFTHPLIYMSFLETVPPTLIAALGLTFVITAGEIDLSFPAVVSLSGFALSWAWRSFDPTYGAWIGIGLALAAGALVGYINGVMVARIGVPSIMATLAANFFWYGISILLAGGLQVTLKGSQDKFCPRAFCRPALWRRAGSGVVGAGVGGAAVVRPESTQVRRECHVYR